MPERVFEGCVASTGLAEGRLVLLPEVEPVARAAGAPAEERRRLERAIVAARRELLALAEADDPEAAEIIEVQLSLLDDPELVMPAWQAIQAGRPAARAWSDALALLIAEYEVAEDEYFRARAADLEDLKLRVLAVLAGARPPCSGHLDGAVIVGRELTPSRFLEIDWSRCRGAALLGGSTTSHVAQLARSREVPLLTGLQARVGQLREGAPVLIDAETGRLVQDPEPTSLARQQERTSARQARAAAEARFLPEPALTGAGRRVEVMVNVDDPSALDRLDPAHCDGIGLTRTEFLLHGDRPPDETAHHAAYARLLAWAGGRPVVVRTLDGGGDKPLPGLDDGPEDNPLLGLRGVRLSLRHRAAFRLQLRALARAAVDGDLRVMVPMVTVPDELEQVRALLDEAMAGLAAEGVPARRPPLGIMVEVPAAALSIDRFEADFLAIGSNDLTQYVTAASRTDGRLARLFDPCHPAVLELICRVAAHGRATGRAVTVCGDMAGDPGRLHALLGCGVSALSVAPSVLGPVKAAIAAFEARNRDGAA